jgi:hypothetical protein
VQHGWKVEAKTQSEGLGLGWDGGATQFYTTEGFAWAGAGRPLVGLLGRAVLGHSPRGYTGRPSVWLFRAVPYLAQRAWGEA